MAKFDYAIFEQALNTLVLLACMLHYLSYLYHVSSYQIDKSYYVYALTYQIVFVSSQRDGHESSK